MCLIVFLFLLRFWPLPSASWRAIYLPWQHCQLKGSTMWLPPFLERIDLWLPIEGSIFHRNYWNYPWIQVRMLGQFSFPQFLQAENNPHSAWTSVKLFLLGHPSSPVVAPSRKQVWQLQMAIKDTDPVIFKSLGCSCYDHQSKISTWIPRPGTDFVCTVVTAQFLHIFTGVSGVGIALWLALFFTGCSFWRRFACFVEPLGGKKHEKTHAKMQLPTHLPNFKSLRSLVLLLWRALCFSPNWMVEAFWRLCDVCKVAQCLGKVPETESETEFRITYFLSQFSYSWGLGCFGYQFKSFGPSGVLELHGRTCRHTGETFGNSEKNYRGKRPQM